MSDHIENKEREASEARKALGLSAPKPCGALSSLVGSRIARGAAIRAAQRARRYDPLAGVYEAGRKRVMDNTIEQMRSLLEIAGREWPKLEQQTGGAHYECPMCGGEGTIDSELVQEGTVPLQNLTLTGVQVFGIGEPMLALSSLMPLVLEHLPAILNELEELRAKAAELEPEGEE